MKTNSKRSVVLTLAALCASLSANATQIFFQDDFESGLGQWHAGQAVLVDDPTHGKVMTFTGTATGGDAWTTFAATDLGTQLYLSFDYRGNGGFLGLRHLDGTPSNDWLAGHLGVYASAVPYIPLISGGTWNHYEIPLPAKVFGRIMLEDWANASAHGAFFDNIIVANYRGAAPSVPDGGLSGFMLILSLGALRLMRGKLS